MTVEVKFLDADDSTKIVDWHKQPGESVNAGEKLVDVETAKTTIEIEVPETGILTEILKPAGEAITSEDVIATIDAS